MNNLPNVVTWSGDSNLRPLDCKSDVLTTTPPRVKQKGKGMGKRREREGKGREGKGRGRGSRREGGRCKGRKGKGYVKEGEFAA